jgi:hypothetical protein
LGDLELSIENLHKYLESSIDKESKSQTEHYNDFINISQLLLDEDQKKAKKFENFQIPKVETNNVKVLINNYGKYFSTDYIPPKSDQEMEESLIKEMGIKNKIFKWDKNYKESMKNLNVIVAGEPVLLEVKFSNPTFTEIPLTKIQLFGSFDPENEEIVESNFSKYFACEPKDTTIGPGKSEIIKLRICPLQKGILKTKSEEY